MKLTGLMMVGIALIIAGGVAKAMPEKAESWLFWGGLAVLLGGFLLTRGVK